MLNWILKIDLFEPTYQTQMKDVFINKLIWWDIAVKRNLVSPNPNPMINETNAYFPENKFM